jgi:hypothetical protein
MLQIVATERGRRGSVDTHPRITPTGDGR